MIQTFSSLVAIKLNKENYLPWKQQAEATIEGHDLLNHITGKGISKKCSNEDDRESDSVSLGYQHWKKQDALLKSWLLSSMSKPFNTRMVGCEFCHQIWTGLETFFASQVKAKIRQLKNKLTNTKKEGGISDYLLQVKSTVDALISIGALITNFDHVEAILNGLTEEYGPFITTIISRSNPISVGELEALLMAQKEMTEHFRKNDNIIHANVA